jgi:nucleoid DNA-binding protein
LALSEYIKDQLLFNGRVTLPGLGSLELVKESARVKGKKIIPPGTWIVFNSEHSKDDGKLAQSLASAEEIDTEEARQKVLEFIDEIVFCLNKGEAFVFEDLGRLFKDNDNTFQFEKNESFVIDFDSFGLESFELEPLEEDVVPVESKPQSQSQPQPQSQPVNSGVTDKNNRNIFWILCGAVVVILTGFIVLKMTTNVFDNASFKLFNFGERDSLFTSFEAGKPETNKAISGELEEKLDSKSKMENALVPDEKVKDKIPIIPVPTREYKEFHIIAGSFKDTTHAQKLALELTMKGYHAVIIEQGNNLYRVSAQSFKDKEAGLKELPRFRGQTKNNAAWLLGLN